MCSECGWVLVWVRLDGLRLRTSRLAIASAVLGAISILCFVADSEGMTMCLLTFTSGAAGISAVICGVAALAYIELERPRLRGRIYALIGILLSAVTFILINVLYGRA